MKVKIINESNFDLPQYATTGSAGMHVKANISEPLNIYGFERKCIPTGLRMALPAGYECQVRPRSGLALKKGLTVLNTPGTIDSDYRGEVGVIIINLTPYVVTIQPGERIAQFVFAKHETAEFEEVAVLDETERGEGGFGHTGL